MGELKENLVIYLAGLLTLSTMGLSAVLDGQSAGAIRYLALFFGVSSLGLAFWPFFTLRRYGRVAPGASYMESTTVVDQGPFAVVRHPQYLGAMSLNVTFMLISPHWLIILVGSSAIMLFYLYARQEEESLVKKFGDEYRVYVGRVPRFNIILGVVRWVFSGGGDKQG